MTSNLPALVVTVGGSLEKVIADIERYTDNRFPLARTSQMALARLIENHPELNTEADLGLLVDALSYHGVNQYKALAEAVHSSNVETVYLALNYLYEVGMRDRGADAKDGTADNSMKRVGEVVDLITKLNGLGAYPTTVESLNDIIYELGGLDLALDATYRDLQSLPFAHSS